MSTFSHRAAALVVCLVACLSLAVARPAHAQLFEQGTFQNTGLSPSGLVSGDVNGDGKADVLMVTFDVPGGMALQVFLADATGFTLTTSTVNVPSFEIGGVTVADVDADGKTDLVVAERHTLYVFWGNGAGQFPTSTLLPGFFDARTVAVGDLNGDGVPDLAVTEPNSGQTLRIVPGRGAHTFAAPIAVAVGDSLLLDVGIADIDGDRRPDLLAAGLNASGNVFVVAHNQGNFGFVAIPPVPFGAGFVRTLTVADVNGDGRADLVASGDSGFTVAVTGPDGIPIVTGTYPVQVAGFDRVTAADLDGDGIADLLAGMNNGSDIALLLGRGDGTFADPTLFKLNDFSFLGLLTTGDVNGDGELDIIAVGASLVRALHVAPLRLTASATAGPTGSGGTASVQAAASVTSGQTDVSFAWSEGTTPLGTGAAITTRLAAGDHVLTVRATSTTGMHAVATTTVSVAAPAASQVSVNALQQALDARLDATVSSRASQASVSDVASRLAGVEGRLTDVASQATLSAIYGTLQNRLDAAVSTRASEGAVAAVGSKVDQLKASLPSAATLDAVSQAVAALGTSMAASQLRIGIEQALARAEMVASFYLPTANGGQLDLVRTITDDVIGKSEAAGGNATNVGRARKLLSDGDARKALGDYRGAYLLYVGAYQVLSLLTR